MAGIYIHIPFCRDACHYCDFHFTISYSKVDEMVDAICREIMLRKFYLDQKEINTIYFGGGTPSSLPIQKIKQILDTIYANHPVTSNPEISFEANPDDLLPGYLDSISKAGINRLSIGIQSFFNDDLIRLNRIHNAEQAETCIKHAREAGFINLNVDLIYGIPGQTISKWSHNIEKVIEMDVPHISAYHLTFEPRTIFNYQKEKRLITELKEKESIEQFKILIHLLKKSGFIHYEISNFAKQGFYSIHNLGYWSQQPYIGIGPSAHSYNGESRQWTYARNRSYIEAMSKDLHFIETESLDEEKKFNEYIMTSLRTLWGTDLNFIKNNFGKEYLLRTLKRSDQFVHSGDMVKKDNKLILTDSGKLISDYIIQNLFI